MPIKLDDIILKTLYRNDRWYCFVYVDRTINFVIVRRTRAYQNGPTNIINISNGYMVSKLFYKGYNNALYNAYIKTFYYLGVES